MTGWHPTSEELAVDPQLLQSELDAARAEIGRLRHLLRSDQLIAPQPNVNVVVDTGDVYVGTLHVGGDMWVVETRAGDVYVHPDHVTAVEVGR